MTRPSVSSDWLIEAASRALLGRARAADASEPARSTGLSWPWRMSSSPVREAARAPPPPAGARAARAAARLAARGLLDPDLEREDRVRARRAVVHLVAAVARCSTPRRTALSTSSAQNAVTSCLASRRAARPRTAAARRALRHVVVVGGAAAAPPPPPPPPPAPAPLPAPPRAGPAAPRCRTRGTSAHREVGARGLKLLEERERSAG